MTSATPINQASPPHQPAQMAASPPNKRDLKSWWRGFKLASSKPQEPQGMLRLFSHLFYTAVVCRVRHGPQVTRPTLALLSNTSFRTRDATLLGQLPLQTHMASCIAHTKRTLRRPLSFQASFRSKRIFSCTSHAVCCYMGLAATRYRAAPTSNHMLTRPQKPKPQAFSASPSDRASRMPTSPFH